MQGVNIMTRIDSIGKKSAPVLFLVIAVTVMPGGIVSCSGNGKYVCPDPIGTIVRDDCQAYKVQYDSLRTKISAGYKGLGASLDVGKQSLRDPSELLQLLSARMLALCHDFNSCRLKPSEYLKKRENLDRTITAIFALAEQLGRKDLPEADRRIAMQRLVEILGQTSGSEPRTSPGTLEQAGTKKKHTGYIGSGTPWFGSTLSPPLPKPLEPGYPQLVWPWGKPYLANVLQKVDQDYTDKSGGKWHRYNKVVGYRPRIGVYLLGEFEADDLVVLSFNGKDKVECPVRKNKKGVVRVSCREPGKIVLDKPLFNVEVRYKKAMDQVPVLIGEMEFNVFRSREKQVVGEPVYTYQLDMGSETGSGWLYFFPYKGLLPPDYEQPHIRVTLQLRNKRPKVTARCYVNGDPVTSALRPGRYSGSSGSVRDEPRYIRTGPGSSRVNPGSILSWQHYDFTLPFFHGLAKGVSPPKGQKPWPGRPGDWKCVVKADGYPVRNLFFTVQENGALVPLPAQDGDNGDMVHPWWMVTTDMIPNPVEAKRAGPWALSPETGSAVSRAGEDAR
ncbi:MAG: hypothetical protein GXP49_09760 [Deltaproteobacteria bacterium]|nr:hypothetical protein [Deltaproteobacteria bacterium]